MSILDRIERVLFGATAAEAVEMRTELAARRAQQRIEQQIIAALEQDKPDEQDNDDYDEGPPPHMMW